MDDTTICSSLQPDFNKSFKDVIQEKLETSVEVCPIHKIHLISAFGKEPICLECGREAISKRSKAITDEIYEEHEKKLTYNWLKGNSMFLDRTLEKATFESYQAENEETKKAKEKALLIARDYYRGHVYNSVFTGTPGSGKSHLAMSILKNVNEYSKPFKKCLFVSVDEIMRKIKNSFNHSDSKFTEEYIVNLLTSADLLVMDDLGAEIGSITTNNVASDFVSRVLCSIVNGRMDKSTIFTTNLTSKELSKMYDNKLISRMLKGSKGHTIKFTAETRDKRIDFDF